MLVFVEGSYSFFSTQISSILCCIFVKLHQKEHQYRPLVSQTKLFTTNPNQLQLKSDTSKINIQKTTLCQSQWTVCLTSFNKLLACSTLFSFLSTVPPTEETLMQNTLWPEMQKLYGHGYEVFSLCATSDGKVLASACRATNEEHAQIILWNTSTWKQIQRLTAHQLTVTQMKFSPNDQYLLSVSRDRRWAMFENRTPPNDATEVCNFELVAITDKKNGVHGRIIWTCDWTHDGRYFATGSRDAKVVAWQRNETESKTSLGPYSSLSTLEFGKNDSVTAIAFATALIDSNYLAAIGLESGCIHICTLNTNWTTLFTIDQT